MPVAPPLTGSNTASYAQDRSISRGYHYHTYADPHAAPVWARQQYASYIDVSLAPGSCIQCKDRLIRSIVDNIVSVQSEINSCNKNVIFHYEITLILWCTCSKLFRSVLTIKSIMPCEGVAGSRNLAAVVVMYIVLQDLGKLELQTNNTRLNQIMYITNFNQ